MLLIVFFDAVKFKEIDNQDPKEKKIIFDKNGKSISVDSLSTGEKQIVFRGAHLLRNLNGMKGGIAFVDEPELSMHPKWQKKVLQYYRNLFTIDGVQSAQLIIATHSEYVLRAALEDRDNVLIIVLTEEGGTIHARRVTAPSVLPSVTAAETNYLAFGVLSSDYHIELYGYLQRKTGNETVKSCDDYISSQTQIYDQNIHSKSSQFTDKWNRTTYYATLPTYIRNQIDHPNPIPHYSENELKLSTELLIKLCQMP